jgi:hypothetical protein
MARIDGSQSLIEEFRDGATIDELAEKYEISAQRIAVKLSSGSGYFDQDQKDAIDRAGRPAVKPISKEQLEALKEAEAAQAREEIEEELEGATGVRDTTDQGY